MDDYIKNEKRILTLRYAKMKFEAIKQGLEILPQRIFKSFSQSDDVFRKIYNDYYDSHFDKKLAPVPQRMNLTKGYMADNICWTTQKAKNRTNGKSIVIINGDRVIEFASARKAELEMKLPRGVLSRALRGSKKYKSLRVTSRK
ncbi:MAG TPA: hypothetical protein P5548_03905 [Candidatus Moranbacteria bacterium]|nr:hypothetical protein [Candidatus Moranbacteria bacterium]